MTYIVQVKETMKEWKDIRIIMISRTINIEKGKLLDEWHVPLN